MYLIKVDPNTRINDKFIYKNIDCIAPQHDIVSNLVSGKPSDATRYQAPFYEKIALDIVTETAFNYPYPYISEKTIRPIACKRMFAIIGPQHMLKFLQDVGFKTWNDIIDESYDDIRDPEKRFLAASKSIKDFCEIPLERIKTYLKINNEKLEHNFQQLANYKQKEMIKLSKLFRKEN